MIFFTKVYLLRLKLRFSDSQDIPKSKFAGLYVPQVVVVCTVINAVHVNMPQSLCTRTPLIIPSYSYLYSCVLTMITGLVGNSLVISVLYVGGLLVANGSITVGQLSSFMLYVIFTGSSVSGLSSFYTELMKGRL